MKKAKYEGPDPKIQEAIPNCSTTKSGINFPEKQIVGSSPRQPY